MSPIVGDDMTAYTFAGYKIGVKFGENAETPPRETCTVQAEAPGLPPIVFPMPQNADPHARAVRILVGMEDSLKRSTSANFDDHENRNAVLAALTEEMTL